MIIFTILFFPGYRVLCFVLYTLVEWAFFQSFTLLSKYIEKDKKNEISGNGYPTWGK